MSEYKAKADRFKQEHFRKVRRGSKAQEDPTADEISAEYWRLVESRSDPSAKPVGKHRGKISAAALIRFSPSDVAHTAVEYGSDIDTSVVGR